MAWSKIFKEYGICAKCGKRMAEPNKALCFECSEMEMVYQKRYLSKMTDEEQEIFKDKSRVTAMTRYHKLKNSGICVSCGRRKALNGNVFCLDCKVRKKKKRMENHSIYRHERPDYGLCFICGRPVYENHRTCKDCYEKRKAQAALNFKKSKVE